MDNDCSSSPLVGRILLLPVTALRYMIDMVSIHMFFMQSCQERPMNINAHSTHVFFMLCCQERWMHVNIHSFSLALPCIRCHINTQSLPILCSMNIAYPGIQLLPTPYSLILYAFSYGQAMVIAICLWFPCLWYECNVMPLSSLQCLSFK